MEVALLVCCIHPLMTDARVERQRLHVNNCDDSLTLALSLSPDLSVS